MYSNMVNFKNILTRLYNLDGKTVFTTADLMLLWDIADKNTLWVYISRYIKKGYLLRISRGVYALPDVVVDNLELVGKIKKGSYISFETVLAQSGVLHQWYDGIYVASERHSEIKNKYGNFVYRAMPESVLLNRAGIINNGRYFIATAERALCDKVYKDGLIYFDDISMLDKEKLMEIANIYSNKRVERDIKKIMDKI